MAYFLKSIFKNFTKPNEQNVQNVEEIKVYFVSGMCNNCKMFDKIALPEGYVKQYIEWYIPAENETWEQYTSSMAKSIDTSKPFILIGYSLGGLIVQEMNNFITPLKTIVISSMTNEMEIPPLFRMARSVNFTKRIPDRMLAAKELILNVFTRFIYTMPKERISEYMVYTDPRYLKWAVYQITNWIPKLRCRNLYHIHGIKDQIFPYEQMDDDVYTVKGGDHLMVLDRADRVSEIIQAILLLAK